MPKLKKSVRRTVLKKRTSSGVYRYYDARTKKRISKVAYFRRLKSYHLRKQKQNFKGKVSSATRKHKITKKKFEGQFAKGIDFARRVNILLSTTTHEKIEAKIEAFFNEVKKRMKSLKYAMYFHLSGQILENGGGRTPFHLNSNRSFLKEYNKKGFRAYQITSLVADLFDLTEPHYKAPDSLVLTTSPDGEEPEDILLQVIGINQRDKFEGQK